MSAPGSLPPVAAAAVRTLPRTATLIPMNPVSPEKAAPKRKQTTRRRPASAKEKAIVPFGLVTLVAVKKMSTARGTTMITITRNWRFRNASRALLDRPGDLAHLGGALVGPEDAPHEGQARQDPDQAGDQGEDQPHLVGAAEVEVLVTALGGELGQGWHTRSESLPIAVLLVPIAVLLMLSRTWRCMDGWSDDAAPAPRA